MKKIFILIIALSVYLLGYSSTLKDIKKRGYLKCGVEPNLQGLSSKNKYNQWTGLYVDYCKALSAGIFLDANKVKFIPSDQQLGLKNLEVRKIDILLSNIELDMSIDITRNVNFAGVIYYDEYGFLTKKSQNIYSAKDLNNKKICIKSASPLKPQIKNYLFNKNIKYKFVFYDTKQQTKNAFIKNQCDALIDNKYNLYRIKLKNSYAYKILSETISKSPKGPIIRIRDDKWLNIARWTLFTLIKAQELGITKYNIDSKKNTNDEYIQAFLGLKENNGKYLHLDNKWAYHIIKQVGNYGEIFERNLGKNSSLHINKGHNALWNQGGLMYSMP